MPFREQLLHYAADVEVELEQILKDWQACAARSHVAGAELAGMVADFTRAPGKRLRPVLMRVAYEGLGGDGVPGIGQAFCALELVQSFLLIHDDIMDHSDLRRGRSTVHCEYAHRYEGRVRDAAHFGQSMGILAGDVAAQQSVLLLARSGCPPERIAAALQCCAEIILDVCYGQALDMMLPERPLEQVTEEEVLRVAEAKTARYTTEGPLHLGAILAGAGKGALGALSAYARPAGVAFQLQDDLLGMFGSEERLGKSVLSDLREGKRTLLMLDAWTRAGREERALLEQALGNPAATVTDLEDVRQVVESTGARAAASRRMAGLAEQARVALDSAGWPAAMRCFLSDLVGYIVDREA